VCEAIELPFEVVSGVDQEVGVLDGSTSLKGKEGLGFYRPLFKWRFSELRLVCEKLTIFPYGQYTNANGLVIYCGFKNLLCYKIEVGIYEKSAKT